MKNPRRPKPLATALVGIALLGLVACAARPAPTGVVPAALQPGDSVRALTTVSASGVQIYECRSVAGASAPAWTFLAPEAQLFDARGRAIGSHGAGPFWAGFDGSRVVGSVRARADAPAPGAIPWLLLATQSTGAAGVLSQVTYIQRLHTEGGVAPAGGCDAASIGRQARVDYRADYRLFVPA
ncbi:DUF3455 domain-containing protein [Hydrogenophaga sp.]|uniref:DUF3455 domain-containing protein n=1 Tax=Hydrogenophaga sp. TaxID=1904254 RepID=UPI003D0C4A84